MAKKNSVAVSEPGSDEATLTISDGRQSLSMPLAEASRRLKAKKEPHVERKEFNKMLRCELTQEELMAAGEKMAQAQQDGQLAEEELASVKKQLQSKVDEFALIANRAGNLIRNKFEYREVKVEKVSDFEKATVTETRLDTGSVIENRPMTSEERQMGLKLEPTE